MSSELFVVDDHQLVLDVIKEINSGRPDFTGRYFLDFKQGFDFLRSRQKMPEGYLVDMRPGDISLEGDLPEKICNYVLQKTGSIDNFYFMTGNVSDHDFGVLERTQAKYILKPFQSRDILELMKKMGFDDFNIKNRSTQLMRLGKTAFLNLESNVVNVRKETQEIVKIRLLENGVLEYI